MHALVGNGPKAEVKCGRSLFVLEGLYDLTGALDEELNCWAESSIL
jgi:hypothetical protein